MNKFDPSEAVVSDVYGHGRMVRLCDYDMVCAELDRANQEIERLKADSERLEFLLKCGRVYGFDESNGLVQMAICEDIDSYQEVQNCFTGRDCIDEEMSKVKKCQN